MGAFYFSDVDKYNAQRSQPTFMSSWALDWCPKDPKFLVGVFRSHLDFVPNAKSSGFSTDGGINWTQAPGIDNVVNIGTGKAKSGSEYPTLYVVGSMASSSGIHRSTDQGATWDKIVDYPLGIFDTIDAIDGDKDLFGQVYASFSSTGFVYGKVKQPWNATPSSPPHPNSSA